MYKAIKDDKIIAISDTDSEFFCLVKDEVVEDTEHTVADYDEYNGECLLLANIPVPTQEEQSKRRAQAYLVEIDPITAHIQRLRDEEPENEKIIELLAERKDKISKIKEKYPYFAD